MNHIERMKAAINHQETDKIAKGELAIAKSLIRQITNSEIISLDTHIEARHQFNMDFINWWGAGTSQDIITESNDNILYLDGWGNKWNKTGSTSEIIEPALKDIDNVDALEYPSFDAYEERIRDIKYFLDNSDLFVFAQIEGVFTPLSWLLGFEEFMVYTCTHESIIKKFALNLAEYYASLAKILIDVGVHGLIIGDDLAYNSGTFLSPQAMREIIFPALKNELEAIKKYKNTPVFLHTDGNINLIMEDIVACGFDGIQSIQPSANMNIEQIKREYGSKLCLMGNIDINYLLPFGSISQIRENVQRTIEIGSKGGGYILSTCNILTKDIPLENAKAMYDAAEEYNILKE